jgi:hypothetical protein
MSAKRAASILVLLLGLGTFGAWMLARSDAVADSPPQTLVARLATGGFTLAALPAADEARVRSSGVTASEAIRRALADEPGAHSAVAYLGSLSDAGAHTGGPETPLAIKNQPVYAVLLDAVPVRLHAHVQGSSPPVPMSVVYFVDAFTGQGILTTTI